MKTVTWIACGIGLNIAAAALHGGSAPQAIMTSGIAGTLPKLLLVVALVCILRTQMVCSQARPLYFMSPMTREGAGSRGWQGPLRHGRSSASGAPAVFTGCRPRRGRCGLCAR